MNKIDALFTRLESESKKAFIVYITAGDPSLRATERFMSELEQSGVDLIELGIPFSDPLADGPTIQRASQRALKNGATIRSILRMVRAARKRVNLPVVFMTYYNPVLRYGVKRFVVDCKRCGVDGIIVPDLPPEEAGELIRQSRVHDFSTIFLAAPTSTKDRLRKISSNSTGFIYYVSLTGVTGARKKLPKDVIGNVRQLKGITRKHVCVGFGISSRSQARNVTRYADGIIVGSAVIKVIEENMGSKGLYRKVARFVRDIEKGVHSR